MSNKNPACVRLTAYFSGVVQGVGFRYAAVSESRMFDVLGYVKNLRDGRVEIVAEGTKEELENFLARLKTVFHRNIKEVYTSFGSASGEFDGFFIAH